MSFINLNKIANLRKCCHFCYPKKQCGVRSVGKQMFMKQWHFSPQSVPSLSFFPPTLLLLGNPGLANCQVSCQMGPLKNGFAKPLVQNNQLCLEYWNIGPAMGPCLGIRCIKFVYLITLTQRVHSFSAHFVRQALELWDSISWPTPRARPNVAPACQAG